jgi:hypothetical protein
MVALLRSIMVARDDSAQLPTTFCLLPVFLHLVPHGPALSLDMSAKRLWKIRRVTGLYEKMTPFRSERDFAVLP